MTEREAFIAAIAADPDDDTARLAFADWLDEHGEQDRAEFVRLSYQLATDPRRSESSDRSPADVRALRQRMEGLFTACAAGWLGPFGRALGSDAVPVAPERWASRLWRRVTRKPRHASSPFEHLESGLIRVDGWAGGPLDYLDMRHGFVTHARLGLDSPSPIRDAGAAFRAEPVNSLWIRFADLAGQWPRLNGAHLTCVRRLLLEVPGEHTPRAAETFDEVLNGGCWSGLDDFQLFRNTADLVPAPGEYVARLARSPLLPGLRVLGLTIEQPDLGPLTTNARLSHLHEFDAGGCQLPHEAADAVAAATFRPNVEVLNLSLNEFGDEGARTLAAVPWPNLQSLDLGCNNLTDAGVRHLLPLAAQLTDLSLTSGEITDAGALALADALDAEKLRSLWLSYNPLSEQAVAALRARFGERFQFVGRADG